MDSELGFLWEVQSDEFADEWEERRELRTDERYFAGAMLTPQDEDALIQVEAEMLAEERPVEGSTVARYFLVKKPTSVEVDFGDNRKVYIEKRGEEVLVKVWDGDEMPRKLVHLGSVR